MLVRQPRTLKLVNSLGGLAMALAALHFFVVPTASAAGASLKISPTSGTFEVGSTFDLSFIVDTGGESVNAVEANIKFPADKLQIVNPAASTSFISIWVTAPTFSNVDGTLRFQGGLPSPGIKTSAAVISTVTFRVRAPGTARIAYQPDSKVLRNDGEGTNILSSTTSADFVLKTPPPAGPIVTSPSHPNASDWWNNPNVIFAWQPLEGGRGYSWAFDQNPKTTPDETAETTATTVTVKADADGLWYFHLRGLTGSWGGTTTVAVQIDTTPPAAFTPEFDTDLLTTEETGTLRFLTTDAASGLDRYEVRQVRLGAAGSNTLFIETISPYIVSGLEAGDYRYIVRAFDRAGNVQEGQAELTVVAGGIPFYARVPLLRNPAVANGVIIGLGVLLTLAVGSLIYRRLRIRSSFRRDLAALERDARKKAEALQHELQDLRQAQDTIQKNLTESSRPLSGPTNQPPTP